jgi:hypothetical protein
MTAFMMRGGKMGKYKYEITRYEIAIALDPVQWDVLNLLEWEEVERVCKKLGADKVEYSGHFGRNFYFRVGNRQEAREVAKWLIKRIEEEIIK